MQKGIKLRGKLQNNKGKSSHIISGKNKKMITVAKCQNSKIITRHRYTFSHLKWAGVLSMPE